jgi:cytochrome c biogenesis protein ResB
MKVVLPILVLSAVLASSGSVLAQDKPSESKAPWDYYKIISTIPADRAFTPLKQSACALLGN